MRRIFVACISEEERFWTALLQDDVDGPIAQIDGDREEVMAWGKKQEAEQHWLHGPDGLLPLT